METTDYFYAFIINAFQQETSQNINTMFIPNYMFIIKTLHKLLMFDVFIKYLQRIRIDLSP